MDGEFRVAYERDGVVLLQRQAQPPVSIAIPRPFD